MPSSARSDENAQGKVERRSEEMPFSSTTQQFGSTGEEIDWRQSVSRLHDHPLRRASASINFAAPTFPNRRDAEFPSPLSHGPLGAADPQETASCPRPCWACTAGALR